MYNSEWWTIPMCECVNLYGECKGVKVQCNARKEGWSVGGSSWVSTSDHGSKVWHKVVHHLRSPTLVEWGDVWCEVYMYVWEMREGEVAIKFSPAQCFEIPRSNGNHIFRNVSYLPESNAECFVARVWDRDCVELGLNWYSPLGKTHAIRFETCKFKTFGLETYSQEREREREIITMQIGDIGSCWGHRSVEFWPNVKG